MVRSTLVTAWFLAGWPTSTSPFLAKATTDGVVRAPSAFATTTGSPPSSTETTELVVPRSIPTARAMVLLLRVCVHDVCVLLRPAAPSDSAPQTAVAVERPRAGPPTAVDVSPLNTLEHYRLKDASGMPPGQDS